MVSTEQPRRLGTANPPIASMTADALGLGFAWVIVELAPDGILVSDDHGRIIMANHQIEHLFGYARDDLVGAQVESLLPPRLRKTHLTHRANYCADPRVRAMGRLGLGLLGCHADGSEFPIEISLSPVATGHGTATIVVVRDASDQRASEQTARAASILDEDERIAADLHDGVINHIFASGLTLASILGRNRLEATIAEQIHCVIDELDAAVREIRDTILARLIHDPDGAPPP